ncbi:MAG TPA: asparagine--tRNA ligase [bacterium]|nr:asparagine--tRNA ligase [bacterium]
MKWVYVEDVAGHAGEEVEVRGWLYHKSSKGKLHFLQVRDGTGTIQAVVFKGDVSDELFALADRLPQESSMIVRGTVREDKRSPLGFELGVTDLVVAQEAAEYPITPKEHGTAFLMENRHLWLRSRRQHAILRVRHEIIRQCRGYFDANGFTLIDSPILTPAACEGTTTLFQTDYFGESAFLTQSGQLYQEAAAFAFGKVYCLGPTFRAEKSKTRRHLMEFWMLEPEVAWLDLDGDMDLAEDMLENVAQKTLEKRRDELKFLERDLAALERVKKPFPRITYDEAIALLNKQGHQKPWGDDFGGDEETWIAQSFDRPVMVHRYPSAVKAFYMKQDPERPEVALCVDVLAPEGYGEIIGGGQREDDLATLEQKIIAHNLPREAFTWYLDLRRFGSVPHAGFGLGIERTVSWLCGLPHVRETIPFPRMLGKIWP